MAKQKPTYENLKTNPLFLNAAYHTLRGLGENTSKDPEEIVDTFLTKRRWFAVNLGAAIGQGDDILNDFSPAILHQVLLHFLLLVEEVLLVLQLKKLLNKVLQIE